MKVLIVDDCAVSSTIMSHIFKNDEVIAACSGEEAIEKARETQFDIALIDVEMPGIGGLEAIRKIHDEGLIVYPGRIYAISAHEEDDMVDAAFEAGADDYFFKTIRPQYLISRINLVRESQRLFQEQAKSKKRWQAIFDMLPDSATITDYHTGKYIDVNQAFLNEIKMDKKDVLDKTAVELGILSTASRKKLIRELSKNDFVQNLEIIYRYPDGTPFYGSISARVVRNGTTYIISVTRNETETRALRQNNGKLADKLRSYEQINANLEEFAASTDEVLNMLAVIDRG